MEQFIDIATREALKSPMEKKYGAVLLHRGKIIILQVVVVIVISMFYVANKYSIHAEQNCIQRCKNKNILKECTLILVKLNSKKQLVKCESCDKCCHVINKYKIKKVITYYEIDK
jgi:hypothetical protein